MGRFARNTQVDTGRSKTEIERTLRRYGADQFGYATKDSAAIVQFRMNERLIVFHLPLPNRGNEEFTHTPSRGTERHPEDALRSWEQACRQRWRALALAIKAKLEAVDSGITDFETEFLAHIVLPGGKTVGQLAKKEVALAYESKKAPRALIGWSEQ